MNVTIANTDNVKSVEDINLGRYLSKGSDQYYEFFKLLLVDFFVDKLGDNVEDICLGIPNCILNFDMSEKYIRDLPTSNERKKDLFIKYFQTRLYIRTKKSKLKIKELCNEFLEENKKLL